MIIDEPKPDSLYLKEQKIIRALGGMAGSEHAYGNFDVGNVGDLDHAFEQTKELVVSNCIHGLYLHKNDYEDSQKLWSEQETVVSAAVEKYLKKAKEIIAKNSDFFHKVSAALYEKGYLTSTDIEKIKCTCIISPFSP